MRSREEKRCEDKLLILKRKLKDFSRELNNLYTANKYNNNQGFFQMRRNSQLLESTINYVSKVDIKETESSDKKQEIKDLYKETLANLNNLEEMIKEENIRSIRSNSQKEIPKIKKNLDNLKLANQELRKFDLNGAFNE